MYKGGLVHELGRRSQNPQSGSRPRGSSEDYSALPINHIMGGEYNERCGCSNASHLS